MNEIDFYNCAKNEAEMARKIKRERREISGYYFIYSLLLSLANWLKLKLVNDFERPAHGIT